MDVDSWRELMPVIRELVWELREGRLRELEVLQGGEVLGREVKLGDVRGPVRVRLGVGRGGGEGEE